MLTATHYAMTYDHARTWEDPDGYGFRLDVYDTGRTHRGRPVLAYELTHNGNTVFRSKNHKGYTFAEIDSDETVAVILAKLSQQPGETDDDLFDHYTPDQLEWATAWGEALGQYVDELHVLTGQY